MKKAGCRYLLPQEKLGSCCILMTVLTAFNLVKKKKLNSGEVANGLYNKSNNIVMHPFSSMPRMLEWNGWSLPDNAPPSTAMQSVPCRET